LAMPPGKKRAIFWLKTGIFWLKRAAEGAKQADFYTFVTQTCIFSPKNHIFA